MQTCWFIWANLESLHSCGQCRGTVTIALVKQFTMRHAALDDSPNLQKPFAIKLCDRTRSPESTWGLILYSDEVTLGVVISTDNRRTLQCVCFSFAEFGPVALSHEESWFAIVVEMISTVSSVAAGMSQLISSILMIFFFRICLGPQHLRCASVCDK